MALFAAGQQRLAVRAPREPEHGVLVMVCTPASPSSPDIEDPDLILFFHNGEPITVWADNKPGAVRAEVVKPHRVLFWELPRTLLAH
ncbi:hypothetical protein GCM10017781_08000 [Deinococcus metalli]|uniref:Uncharacterized protein n=1 Tax=Deinococcus metalli TaxID=1141878 RepID=A0ABQ3JJ70_9DEIO|nr:hypothetical protein GCM10017781_08000 [Deinococcus metalli]